VPSSTCFSSCAHPTTHSSPSAKLDKLYYDVKDRLLLYVLTTNETVKLYFLKSSSATRQDAPAGELLSGPHGRSSVIASVERSIGLKS
jgi:hypothetical protein